MQKEPKEGVKEIRPGKVEAPKPEPDPAPAAPPASQPAEETPQSHGEDPVIAPDGEPEPKRDPIPLY